MKKIITNGIILIDITERRVYNSLYQLIRIKKRGIQKYVLVDIEERTIYFEV